MIAILLASLAAPAIGVTAVEGEPLAAALVTETLRGYEGLMVLSLADPVAVLGGVAAARYAACTDDRCRAEVLAPAGAARLVLGEIKSAGAGRQLRLRLVDSSTSAAPVLARVSQPVGEGGLRAAVIAAVEELFPELAASRLGSLTVLSDHAEASVHVDGALVGLAPVGPLRLPAGPHSIVVRAPRHTEWADSVELRLGEPVVVRARHAKRRSQWPLALAGGAAGAAVIGLVLGLNAQSIVDDWAAGCAEGRCQAGFTRLAYERDGTAVDVQAAVANGFFGVAAGLAVASVVYFFADPGEEGP